MKEFNNFKFNLKFTFECHRNSINFLDLNVKLNNDKFITNVYVSIDLHYYLHYRPSLIQTKLNRQLFKVKPSGQVAYVNLKKILLITLKR